MSLQVLCRNYVDTVHMLLWNTHYHRVHRPVCSNAAVFVEYH